jgi:HEAT repeat protein
MNRGKLVIVALVVALAVGGRAVANDGVETKSESRKCAATENLLIAIKSENDGLRESAAYLLGEFKCTEAVIPLMDVLHNDPRPATRAVAALALCWIGDERGIFAVKRAVRFDDDPTVQLRCAWFVNEYVKGNTFAFVPVDETRGANLASK